MLGVILLWARLSNLEVTNNFDMQPDHNARQVSQRDFVHCQELHVCHEVSCSHTLAVAVAVAVAVAGAVAGAVGNANLAGAGRAEARAKGRGRGSKHAKHVSGRGPTSRRKKGCVPGQEPLPSCTLSSPSFPKKEEEGGQKWGREGEGGGEGGAWGKKSSPDR